ncbi:MAG TPA: hypothetical protein VGF48_26095 [Thermoanaerobaculia bacterium]|jgi:hypothetical protein
MRTADKTAIRSAIDVAAVVRLTQDELAKAIPVMLRPLDAFAEPEPSRGATIELASGRHVVVIYGEVTGRLSVHTASDDPEAVDDFLTETGISAAAVEWRRPSPALATSSPRTR